MSVYSYTLPYAILPNPVLIDSFSGVVNSFTATGKSALTGVLVVRSVFARSTFSVTAFVVGISEYSPLEFFFTFKVYFIVPFLASAVPVLLANILAESSFGVSISKFSLPGTHCDKFAFNATLKSELFVTSITTYIVSGSPESPKSLNV